MVIIVIIVNFNGNIYNNINNYNINNNIFIFE